MKRSDKAVQKFKDGYNCAQSVLFSFADILEISEDYAVRIATGFGAGMGRKQEVCGAVSGAILVLNHLYGRGDNENKEKQNDTYAIVRNFMNRFVEKNGTTYCKTLLNGCDLLTENGVEKFKSENLVEQCYGYVADAVEILDEIIIETANMKDENPV